jgi:hypothetical protein
MMRCTHCARRLRKIAAMKPVFCPWQMCMVLEPVGPKCAERLGLPLLLSGKPAADTARKPRRAQVVRITLSRPVPVDPRQMALPLEAA